jgi:hypothetical protein
VTGLRYEFYPLMTRADRGLERYDPTTNLVLIGRRCGNQDNVGIDVSHRFFAPRVGGISFHIPRAGISRAVSCRLGQQHSLCRLFPVYRWCNPPKRADEITVAFENGFCSLARERAQRISKCSELVQIAPNYLRITLDTRNRKQYDLEN